AVSRASPALQTAKTTELKRFRSPIRLATMVATIVPAVTPQRAFRPKAINVPAATPAAGQNSATPSGVSRARLIFADRANGEPERARPTPRRLNVSPQTLQQFRSTHSSY